MFNGNVSFTAAFLFKSLVRAAFAASALSPTKKNQIGQRQYFVFLNIFSPKIFASSPVSLAAAATRSV